MLNSPRLVEATEATSLWVGLLDLLMNSPEVLRSAPRGEPTRELVGVTLRLRNGYQPVVNLPARKLNYHFMVAEWMWIALGRDDLNSITHYNKAISRFSDDGQTFFGAYGPRWTNQIGYVVRKLREDADSRQAVLTIWRPNPPGTRDVPCTVAMQYLVRQDQVHAIVTMRSSDVWLGIPYDVFNFSMLANLVAGEVGLPLGEVRLQLGSSHMYDSNLNAASDVLAAYKQERRESPTMPQLPGLLPADAKLWWQLAKTGHVATAKHPWFDFLQVLAGRATPEQRYVGEIGKLVAEQRGTNEQPT